MKRSKPTSHRAVRMVAVAGLSVALTTGGCAFQGVNSLPLPGAVGRGSDAKVFHAEIANVAMLEPNSPVMINDVVVGSVRKMTVKDWHADVEFSVLPDVVVPENVQVSVGQTSLLGSMHLALKTPLNEQPHGALAPGTVIPIDSASTFPTTEKTLSSLAAVVNGGGLGQIGDVIHNFSIAMSGREADFRDLLTRMDKFVTTLDTQRDNIIATIRSMNRLASTFAEQNDVISDALVKIPPALEVLSKQRPKFVSAMQKFGTFSATVSEFSGDSKDDLVANLANLEPAFKALADVGPSLAAIIEYAGHFPFTQSFMDRSIRGDFYNLFATIDLTVPRLKHSLMLGTRWEQQDAGLVPTYGDPTYLNYTYDPLKTGVAAPPPLSGVPQGELTMPQAPPPPANIGPVLPAVPPQPMLGAPQAVSPPADSSSSIFAGPYGNGG